MLVQTHDLDFQHHSCDLFCVQLFELEVIVVVLLILVELLTIVHLLNFLILTLTIYHMLILLLYLTKLKFVDIVCPLSFFYLKKCCRKDLWLVFKNVLHFIIIQHSICGGSGITSICCPQSNFLMV